MDDYFSILFLGCTHGLILGGTTPICLSL